MPKYKVVYLESARRDIGEAVFYIADTLRNPAAAESLLDSIDEKTRILREGLWKGQSLKNHSSGLFADVDLSWCRVRNYYLFFRIDEREKVIRVYHFSHKLRGLAHVLKETESF
ncbi:MAG: type II toxin-antitoxin system RelE/ParE family toxin [Synergistaceae bacterium]|jgi:plasmid stabilization system protein ParE|nr:type II toxin-antitoxin system RelE/ParE family toxin [Synergistaceae bacterium]